jgi:hypothetical protein
VREFLRVLSSNNRIYVVDSTLFKSNKLFFYAVFNDLFINIVCINLCIFLIFFLYHCSCNSSVLSYEFIFFWSFVLGFI